MESKSPAPEPDRAGKAAPARKEIGGKKFRVGAGDTYVPFRSRTRRRRRLIAAGVMGVLVLTAGIYGAVTLISPPAPAPAAAACPAHPAAKPTPTAPLPNPAQVTVNVYNASAKRGAAAATATVLKQRGFTIGKVTNDPLKENLTIAAQVRGGAAGVADMRVVAAEVSGSQLQSDSRGDTTVDLVLGSGFTALSAPQQVAASLVASTASPAKDACEG